MSGKLNIFKTFECGQCFRWNADPEGIYTGCAGNIPAELFENGGNVYISSPAPLSFWRNYFDLDSDYSVAESIFAGYPYLAGCTEYGHGIRILRQDPWEALCSFIISQCNNITRIKGIIERLCGICGETIEFKGRQAFLFPNPETVSRMTEEELAPLRAGYRTPYIINAARKVASGELNLDRLKDTSCEEARSELIKLQGIGPKVADCAVLFGLHHMEAFPKDVWIKRTMKKHFPPGFDPAVFGDMAGLAQQYIFFYARSGEKEAE